MYKVIYQDQIIDVIDNLKYVRYIKKTGRVTLCDKSSAHGIYSSNGKSVYMLQGKQLPEAAGFKSVTVHKINSTEYAHLCSLLQKGTYIVADVTSVQSLQETKIKEMSECCNRAITEGVKVRLSDNVYHHFRLTLEDQLNLYELKLQVDAGKNFVVYHETNNVCTKFSAEDFAKLYNKVIEHKHYHTTYFNLLKYCINNMYDINKIQAIEYGVNLKDLNISTELLLLLEN